MARRMLRNAVSPPAVSSYDSEWEEVKAINGYAVVTAYVSFAITGLGYLVVTWTTVVLLGGFVSMIDSDDFWCLALITLVQILWINASFLQRFGSIRDLLSSLKAVNNLFTRSWVQADNPRVGHQIVKQVVAALGCIEALVHTVVLRLCLGALSSVMLTGMFMSIWISIRGLMRHDSYRGEGKDDGSGTMGAAHDVLYGMCVFQGALWLYKIIMMFCKKRVVKQVSQAYGFQECSAVQGYMDEIVRGCFQKPSSARGRNLITYAIELMESKSPRLCLSGTLILDRLLARKHSDNNRASNLIEQDEKKMQQQQIKDMTRAPFIGKTSKEKQQQLEDEIIFMQRRVIKGLIGSASYTHILQKLLLTLDPRSSHDRKMRDAAVRIVEHVADGIRLEQFPQGIQCISSLINTFEEYHRLQPYRLSSSSKSEPSKSESDNGMDKPSSTNQSKANPFHGYKELVLIGLRILHSLAASCDNCVIISNTKHLVSKIVAPVSYDLVHRTHHSDWSTRTVKESLRVMFLLVTADGEVGAMLRRRVSSDDKAVATMERIVGCEECKSQGLQITAMQILTLLACAHEMEIRFNLTKMLVGIIVDGDSSDVYVRMAAGEALMFLFFGKRSTATILPGENNDAADFVGALLKIVSRVGKNDACRISAAKILERVCVVYTENDEYLSTFRNDMANVMPMVLREILLGSCGSTGQEGSPIYARSDGDVESQVVANGGSVVSQVTTASSSPVKHQDNGLHLALLSLCVTACEELHLEFDAMNPAGEGATFSFVREMVQLNKDITVNCLGRMKLATRMVIAMVKHRVATNPVDLDLASLMNLLSSVSENMLDLESSMVFDTGMTTTTRTLDSLVEEARELHSQSMEQDLLVNIVRERIEANA